MVRQTDRQTKLFPLTFTVSLLFYQNNAPTNDGNFILMQLPLLPSKLFIITSVFFKQAEFSAIVTESAFL